MGWPKALRHLHRTGKVPRMSYRISGSIWWLVGYPEHLYDGKHRQPNLSPVLMSHVLPAAEHISMASWELSGVAPQVTPPHPGVSVWNWIHPSVCKVDIHSKPAVQHKDSPDQMQNEAKCSLHCISVMICSATQSGLWWSPAWLAGHSTPQPAVPDPAQPWGARLLPDPDQIRVVLQPCTHSSGVPLPRPVPLCLLNHSSWCWHSWARAELK